MTRSVVRKRVPLIRCSASLTNRICAGCTMSHIILLDHKGCRPVVHGGLNPFPRAFCLSHFLLGTVERVVFLEFSRCYSHLLRYNRAVTTAGVVGLLPLGSVRMGFLSESLFSDDADSLFLLERSMSGDDGTCYSVMLYPMPTAGGDICPTSHVTVRTISRVQFLLFDLWKHHLECRDCGRHVCTWKSSLQVAR